ncbi:MAG: diphosphate--fructose-6-phosphate 1-phosphotransferase [Planctomycetes bacterium]|nr:diphosphate--fructose-6-phosphate 1-phosphotransferase [Planctomycetota bacterium]MCC8115997.1 diphosphate--fructose-6-phosphate 1-phosphotransferase [Planctomycetota bacterium]MCD7895551.1 diphosphate--fructose-6-phosphate 1-phosphotransferase [Planctomycetaceae bacterium]
MADTIKGKAVIFTQGGPTAVINASWVGVVQGLMLTQDVEEIWGAINGIDGIMNEVFVDLKAQTAATLQDISFTPASQLRSTRKKPTAEDNQRMLDVFLKHNIRYVFGIGGNDTSESLDIINDAARQREYELRVFHVAKTVDNDLMENDHTPGYGSAARYVANAFRGVSLDNQCFGGLYIGVCMGRHAGFLTAASTLGRLSPEDGPHLVYLPECPFSLEKFAKDVEAVYTKYNRCVVAVSEGIEDENHTPILAVLAKDGKLECDSHGNVQLSGTGALADSLVNYVKEYLEGKGVVKKLRARGDTFGYIQRSFPEQSPVDREESLALGRFAASCAQSGNIDGSCAIVRVSDNPYKSDYKLVPLKNVAGKTRRMPPEFIAPSQNDVTEAFMTYGKPLIGELSPIGILDMSKKVKI